MRGAVVISKGNSGKLAAVWVCTLPVAVDPTEYVISPRNSSSGLKSETFKMSTQ